MKLIESIKQIISEASKKQILMDKIGFNEENADLLDKLCGSLSVWMGNKFIDYYSKLLESTLPEYEDNKDYIKEVINNLNNNFGINSHRRDIISIMDWVRIGLNGNLGENKELKLGELHRKSKLWHDSLEVGQGDINYKETHPTLLDFTDENGNGFYWADLDTKNSPEECERMGHCGRSSYGYLYSLRQVIPLNNKYKLNKSVLTAAIGSDGIMYQLKGVKNSKPEEKYQEYILPLFYVLTSYNDEDDDEDKWDSGEEDYLIQGFGTEYQSEQDFKLSDLPEQTIKDLYQNRPELFSSRPMKRLLDKMGIINVEPMPVGFTLEIKPEDFDDYIDGGSYNTYTNRTTKVQTRVSIFVEIMSGDAWDLWNQDGYEDFGGYFQYTIDQPTEEKLWAIVRDFAQRDGIELDENLDLEEAIDEVDSNGEIKQAIGSAISDADANDYVDYLQKEIETALEFYGNVYEFNDTGAKIQVDLKDLVDIDNQEVDDIFENNMGRNGQYDFDGVLRELISEDYIEKPNFDPDDRWYPSPDSSVVNENVRYRLDDIEI
jgi:hypothetical protein